MHSSHRRALRAASGIRPAAFLRSFKERIGIAAFAILLVFALSQSLWAHEFKAGDIHVGHPFSRATPPGAKVAAGYLTLRNDGATPDRLVSAAAEIGGKTEIHEMKVDDKGVMTMRPLAGGVEIAPGAEVKLAPGGIHLMFMELGQPAREGVKFKGTLTFEKAGTVEVEFAVEAMGSGMGGNDHGSHGG